MVTMHSPLSAVFSRYATAPNMYEQRLPFVIVMPLLRLVISTRFMCIDRYEQLFTHSNEHFQMFHKAYGDTKGFFQYISESPKYGDTIHHEI